MHIMKYKLKLIEKDINLRDNLLKEGASISSQAGFNIIKLDGKPSDNLEAELKMYYINQSLLFLLNNSNDNELNNIFNSIE